jgi:anti-sigma B factor antagonist
LNIEIEIEKEGKLEFLNLKGEIDVYSSPSLKEKVLEEIDKGVENLVINLEKVSYIDSTGLGILIGTLKRMKEREGKLYLIFSSQRLKRIFEITGLNKIFSIYESKEKLLNSLKEGGENK